ncbi:MAG: hypothetical protein AABX88_00195 [Nanoarchaeota archaeon]
MFKNVVYLIFEIGDNMKKCIYCSGEISHDSVIDFCERCGVRVWGEKMFKAILQNMESARDNGDLCTTNLPVSNAKSSR